MSCTVTYTNHWKPSLTESDAEHLRALGIFGATVKGNPSKSHLKRKGEVEALCGAKPGQSRARKMVARSGWLLYESFEGPGRTPCEACLKAAEGLSIAAISKATGSGS